MDTCISREEFYTRVMLAVLPPVTHICMKGVARSEPAGQRIAHIADDIALHAVEQWESGMLFFHELRMKEQAGDNN
jgi:hypothetical protein